MINSIMTFGGWRFGGWRIDEGRGKFIVTNDDERYEFQTQFAASSFLNIAIKCDPCINIYSVFSPPVTLNTMHDSYRNHGTIIVYENGQLVYVDLLKILWVGIKGPAILRYLKRFWYGEKYAD